MEPKTNEEEPLLENNKIQQPCHPYIVDQSEITIDDQSERTMEAETYDDEKRAYIERLKETERVMKDSSGDDYILPFKKSEITIDDEDEKYSKWCVSILEADENNLQDPTKVNSEISKVPEKFTKLFGMDMFTPKVVSIGPYHHGKDELKSMQNLKPLIAKKFIKQNKEALISTCCKAIILMINEVRDSYDVEFIEKFTDVQLTEMMFLDGCFVLHLMYCISSEEIHIKKSKIELVRQDLVLMDNQIPWKVLNCLVENIDQGYIHLLDYARKSLLGKPNIRVFLSQNDRKGPTQNYWNSPTLRTVKQLRAVGIYFNENGGITINDISFKSFGICARLSLPRLQVDNSTRLLFSNMIAYESCTHRYFKGYGITSYISFLDSLIDNAEDVKELRSAGIIINNLNSNEEVAELINDIGSKLVPNVDTLLHVKIQMEKYLSSKRKVKIATWFTEVIDNHFRSPLTIFIVIAATFAIFLTVVQTYYAVFE